LTLLGFFKYWNFFSDTLFSSLHFIGIHPSFTMINVILPVGISFYTFQKMAYSIDVFRGKQKPTHSFLNFALFVSFFPLLLAGPIERASALLPQIENSRQFNKDKFIRGLNLIFWGLFMKVFVADNLAVIVKQIYGNKNSTGVEYIIATWAFAFQIYGDFSGYTDIARGVSKCLGIDLIHNFKNPYFSIDPSDFWRRWHISLSTWLRDYLYIPMGGNKTSREKTYRNLMVTMLLGGLWHGSAWNFIIWGGFHGMLLCIHRFSKNIKIVFMESHSSIIIYMAKAFVMFQFICIGWIFFRAESYGQIKTIMYHIVTLSSIPIGQAFDLLGKVSFFIAIPFAVMLFQILKDNWVIWEFDCKYIKYVDFRCQPLYLKSFLYACVAYLLCFYGAKAQSFIYLQF
jgi:D-alanyl-lipoteichoic acid acyltransferase DltB (MBOAT superfamily)